MGSEDLYRISPTGIENNSGVGAGPDDISNYIGQVRTAIANTAASGALVGHVDTWTAWVNGSNQAAIDACDFIGMDAYPYFQNTIANGIDIGQQVFNDALGATRGAVGGKPVWITETGWPVSGPQQNQAVASIPNAQTYWDQVACEYMGNTNLWWYTIQDALPGTPSPSFGLVGAAGGTTPLFDLTCPNGAGSSASSSSSLAPSASAAASSVASEVSAAATGGSAAPTQDSGSPGASALQGSSAAGGSSPAVTPASSSDAPVPSGSGSDKSSAIGGGSSVVDMTTYETTTLCPITVTGSAGAVSTVLSTSTLTVTSCAGGCSHPATGVPSVSTAAPAQSGSAQPAAPAPSATSTSTAGACPADLSGSYEYPHLIVPVDKDQPNTALGTSYNGTISPSVSSVYNFDIPHSDEGKTCTLVFMLPEQQDLETSSFSLSGSGGIDVNGLTGPADQSTSYSNAPAVASEAGSVPSVAPGNTYTISSGPCAAGAKIAYELSSTGSLDLEYFQDYNPSPIGLYITKC